MHIFNVEDTQVSNSDKIKCFMYRLTINANIYVTLQLQLVR